MKNIKSQDCTGQEYGTEHKKSAIIFGKIKSELFIN